MRATPRTSLAAAVAAALVASGCGGGGGDARQLTVLTWNLYLGANLAPALSAANATEVALAATSIWTMVRQNDFPDRARALADRIAAARPDVVALQEATLWRTQDPGNLPGGGLDAPDVAYDHLESLRAELNARGLRYTTVVVLPLSDLEVPTFALGRTVDVRLTDRDAILVREGLAYSSAASHVFSDPNLLTVSAAGTSQKILRGWTRVTVTVAGQPITVVNTHLESEDGAVRTAQAAELFAALSPETGRVVVTGDLNSAPGTEGHLEATKAGFRDAWAATHGAEAGLTCCWPEDLSTSTPPLSSRIDLVLTRGALTPTGATVYGATPGERSPGGRWPSDHAGMAAGLHVD